MMGGSILVGKFNRIYLKAKFLVWRRLNIFKADNLKITFIVFSKDRAIQLHALLKSLNNYIVGEYDVKILYAVSDDGYSRAYKALVMEFKDFPTIQFYKENNFKTDLDQIVSQIAGGRIFFLVDDILFKNPFNLSDLEYIDSNTEIFSLRHGIHLSYSYVVYKDQNLPTFNNFKKNKKFLQWRWSKSELDWAYPLSVDGHLYNLWEVKFWIKKLTYKSPNSFEGAIQLLKSNYMKFSGVCCNESIIFNNPCNKVQLEVANIHGTMHQSRLLQLWDQGYIIDYKIFEGYNNNSVHEEVNFTLIKRGTNEGSTHYLKH